MKRITLYSDELDGDDTRYMDFSLLANQGIYQTKHEQREYREKLWIQREEYQKRNKTFLSDERKRAWMK